jgi:hypothetical protein
MHSLHVAAGVGAQTAGGGTDLLDQLGFQVGDVCVCEKAINALILGDIADEIIDHSDNSGLAAEPFIKALLRRRFLRLAGAGEGDHSQGGEGEYTHELWGTATSFQFFLPLKPFLWHR